MSEQSEQPTTTAETTPPPAHQEVLYCTICGAQVPKEAAALHNAWHAQFADPGTFSAQLSPVPEILALFHGLAKGPGIRKPADGT